MQSDMTWKEFKDFVDSEIKKQGFDENVEIEYIDMSYPSLEYPPCVACDKDGLVINS